MGPACHRHHRSTSTGERTSTSPALAVVMPASSCMLSGRHLEGMSCQTHGMIISCVQRLQANILNGNRCCTFLQTRRPVGDGCRHCYVMHSASKQLQVVHSAKCRRHQQAVDTAHVRLLGSDMALSDSKCLPRKITAGYIGALEGMAWHALC